MIGFARILCRKRREIGLGVEDRLSRRDVLRSGVALVAGMACEGSLRGETYGVFAEPEDEGWAIGNKLIRRDVGFRPGVGLYTKQLSNMATKTTAPDCNSPPAIASR